MQKHAHKIWSQCIMMFEKECQDIDTLEDWKMAELKYKVKYGI